MKKNIVKTMLKVMAATAMVAAMVLVPENEAKACSKEECCMCGNGSYDAIDALFDANPDLTMDDYAAMTLCSDCLASFEADMNAWMADGSVTKTVYKDVTVKQSKMLGLVNADRAKNGAGNLVWNADLEDVARQRAVEMMNNALTTEYANALDTGDYAKQCEIIHKGARDGMGENAIVSNYTGVKAKAANQNWIASEGHHVVRINAGYTQYACASYTDPVTGFETWVELFQ